MRAPHRYCAGGALSAELRSRAATDREVCRAEPAASLGGADGLGRVVDAVDDLVGVGDAVEDEVGVVAAGGVEVDVADLHAGAGRATGGS